MNKVIFQIFENSLGFCAIDSNGNCGYGNSTSEAIADLQLAYDDAEMEVFNLEFYPE